MKKNQKILNFQVFQCGFEEFDFSELYKKCNINKKILPVNVILIEHKKFGNILINTGCSRLIKKSPVQFAKLLTEKKLSFEEKDCIINQLDALGMDPLCIKKVLLTHCDPECCGGLPLLPNYELISGARVLGTLFVADPVDGVMKNTLPADDIKKSAGGIYQGESILKPYFKWIFDMFGDGSVLGFDISGHRVSMMGYFIPELNFIFAADASIDEIALKENLIPSKKLLEKQKYPKDYLSVLDTLKKLSKEHPEINIAFSHSERVENS